MFWRSVAMAAFPHRRGTQARVNVFYLQRRLNQVFWQWIVLPSTNHTLD
jgi:hypothetical protein